MFQVTYYPHDRSSRWGRVFLNNRYHDPTLGQFISVDPLVVKTGEPYIYGAANPITYSDPTGLDPDTAAWVRKRAWDERGQSPTGGDGPKSDNDGCVYSATLNCPLRGSDPTSVVPSLRNRLPYVVDNGRVPPPMPPIGQAPRLWSEVLVAATSLSDPDGWGTGLGGCLEVGGSAGATGGGSSCLVIDTDGISSVSSVAYGVAVGGPGLSGSTGPLLSNTEAKLLAGYGICGNIAGGAGFGGAGALCGGIANQNGAWSATGGWTFYLGASVTTPSVESGYTYTYAWVDRLIGWPW